MDPIAPQTLRITATQFLDHAVPAAAEYLQAEKDLSKAWAAKASEDDPAVIRAQKHAIRKASEAAISLSSLIDRAAAELGTSKADIVREIQSGCSWPDGPMRERAAERVRSVADAYKHHTLDPNRHQVTSADDILATGLSYGADAFGVGKYSGVEVMARESVSGRQWKFLGDMHVLLRSWKAFLEERGVDLPDFDLPM